MSDTTGNDAPELDINGNPMSARPADIFVAPADEPAPESILIEKERLQLPPAAAPISPVRAVPLGEPRVPVVTEQRFDLAGNPLPVLPPAPASTAKRPPPVRRDNPLSANRIAYEAARRRRRFRDGLSLTGLALGAGFIIYLFLNPQVYTKIIQLIPIGSNPTISKPLSAKPKPPTIQH